MDAAGAAAAASAAALPDASAPQTAPADRPAKSRQTGSGQKTQAVRQKARRRKTTRRAALAAGGVGCVAAAGVVAVTVMSGGGPSHAISTPLRLGSYVEEPSLANGMGANALRDKIVAAGGGEATHVVDAVYEDSTGAAKSGPLIILFVGGNLSGSASSFITSLTTAVPGAFVINPGSLAGQAACVPGTHLNECAWADNDTFGVIASPVLSATELGEELRTMRPMVEHVVK